MTEKEDTKMKVTENKIYNPAIECMDRDELKALQLSRLQETVKLCYERVPLYRQRMDALGVKPEDIKTLSDITKLPFTNKTDLRDEFPFGLFAADKKDIVRHRLVSRIVEAYDKHKKVEVSQGLVAPQTS